jgi:hypothetical protein
MHTDISAELDEYLTLRNIRTIIAEIVEKLLLLESSSPYYTILEFLSEKYPQEVILALEILHPEKHP